MLVAPRERVGVDLNLGGAGRRGSLAARRAQLRDQVIHLLDFFDKGPGAHRTDGRQSKPANVQAALLHQHINPVNALGQGFIGPLVGALHPAGHDDDAGEPLSKQSR